MPNRLGKETSPYLRQHQHNPVDWYAWGKEALSKAKTENKPIFLSIGYAACHWCHVMAHESFEDLNTAEILNENFINIKVDREERPDLDDIYMRAVTLLTGRGGWPMSVFLTPDLNPFYGGTYFPPTPRHGLPSFNQVLMSVIDAWKTKQEDVINNASLITQAIESQNSHDNETSQMPDLDKIVDTLHRSYDWKDGGWGQAPKFPQPMVIEFLIQRAFKGNNKAKDLVEHVLDRMARGGMYDHVGGGFHRYSTDGRWLVPHFEKMLYDNAQLTLAYLHGYALTGNSQFRQVSIKTLEFIQNELTSPTGGFYSSLDADTPEGEGRFYAWQVETLKNCLSQEQFDLVQEVFQLREKGNFEADFNILQYRDSLQSLASDIGMSVSQLEQTLMPIYDTLYSQRSKREHPEKDTKIITEWNALAITAFAQGGLILGRDDFLASAKKAADFILTELQIPHGSLKRSWSQGKANHPGTLMDYTGMILALHALYEVDFSPETYQLMLNFYQTIQNEFASEDAHYFDAGSSVTDLIVRPQRLQDNATPSGNALAGHVQWLFGNYEHDQNFFNRLSKMIVAVNQNAKDYPTSFGYWLRVIDLTLEESQQIALVSENRFGSLQPFLEHYRSKYRPHSIIAAKFKDVTQEKVPGLLVDRPALSGKPTAYVCRGFTCRKPVTSPEAFNEQLNQGADF